MNTLEALARACLTASPAQAAHAIDAQDPEDAAKALESLPIRTTAPVLDRLSPVVCARILEHLPRERCWALMQSMKPLEAAALLPHLTDQARAEILLGLPERTLRKLQELARYSKSQAGGMMDPNVVAIPEDLNVKQAIALIRKAPRQSLYYFYVIDRERVLKGVLSMRDLLLSRPTTKVKSILIPEVVSIPATMPQREVADFMRQRRFLALPVVDHDRRLIGVVKHDRALSAAKDHAFEDMQKMFGAGAHEQALSPTGTVIRRRLPWLLVNLVTAFVAAAVVLPFAATITEFVALAVLLPVVLSQAHATGSQTLAVVMRGLAVHEIGPGKGPRVLWKELRGGFVNGFVVALCASLVVLILQWPDWKVAVVIGLALTINMAASAGAAASIPFALRFFGRDPAQASSIAMTTFTDVIGIATFLGIAVALL